MARVITFGEIMLRLKSPGFEKLMQTPSWKRLLVEGKRMSQFSLANFGLDAAFVTALPDMTWAKPV